MVGVRLMKPRVLVVSRVHPSCVKELKEFAEVEEHLNPGKEKLKELLQDKDVLVTRIDNEIDKDIIDSAEELKLICSATSGLNHIDVKHAEKKGIEVMNAPLGPLDSVAEMVLALMLSSARRVPQISAAVKQGEWDRNELGTELTGKTLGIIGLGNIGTRVAEKVSGFRMKIMVHDPYIPKKAIEEVGKPTDLENLLKESDFITMHVPLMDSTKGMIGEQEFSLMKPTAFLINTSRGGVLNQEALHSALKEKKIAGAALDVLEKEPPGDEPILQLDNVIVTPHMSSSTEDAQKRIGMEVVGNIRKRFK